LSEIKNNGKVLITGGAGYVGSELVKLLATKNYSVIVYDTFWYRDALSMQSNLPKNVQFIKADIRDKQTFEKAIQGCETIIHLACISNDPSFDLNPKLGKAINYDCFENLVLTSKINGVKKFLYASSSSVYGIKKELNVTEDLPKEPLTDYSNYKSLCEDILLKYNDDSFTTTILRPATVCGYSERQRFDVIVNILTNHAINRNEIKVFNGTQKRPNIHIEDMCNAYLTVMEASSEIVSGKIYNVGADNFTVKEIAERVSTITNVDNINIIPDDDNRSYHISSKRILNDLNFRPQKSISDAIKDLMKAFNKNLFTDSLNNEMYFNVKFLNNHKIK